MSPDVESGSSISDAAVAEGIKANYEKLNAQITTGIEKYVGKAKEATADFDAMMPLFDQMQSLLSQRGERRKVLDKLGLPSWMDWFTKVRPSLKEDVTLRTIQRKLQDYRGKKPTKTRTRQKYDAVDILHLEKVAKAAEELAASDIDNAAYNPIRAAIAQKPDGGSAAVGGLDNGGVLRTPVHTQIVQLALELAQSTLSYEGVPEHIAELAQQIVDLMIPPAPMTKTDAGTIGTARALKAGVTAAEADVKPQAERMMIGALHYGDPTRSDGTNRS